MISFVSRSNGLVDQIPLRPRGPREVRVGGDVVLGVDQKFRSLGEVAFQRAGDLAQLGSGGLGAGLREDGAHERSDNLGLTYGTVTSRFRIMAVTSVAPLLLRVERVWQTLARLKSQRTSA